MDGKLAALAHFSATLDEDLPLSWSSAVAFGAAAVTAPAPSRLQQHDMALSSDGDSSSSTQTTRVVEASSQSVNSCVAADVPASPAAAEAAAAHFVSDGSENCPALGDAHTHTPGDALEQRLALCEHAPTVTPGDALEQRLARKRHMAAAVEADAALTAAWSPLQTATARKRRATSAASSKAGSDNAGSSAAPTSAIAQEQAAGSAVPAPSPPAPAAEVVIAAARHATEQAVAQRGVGLWRRMLGGLGVVSR
jgi:hypothetical protein